jgi:RNA polymerase sigma-70 factor (ECF subfamily)
MNAPEIATATDIGIEDFSGIVQRNRPFIYRFLLASLRDADLAETLTQECFLKAYRSWLRFRGESAPSTWLMRIAINLQKDHWRSRKLQFWRHAQVNAVALEVAREWLPSIERSPEERVSAQQQVARIWKAVKNLRGVEQTVFLLRYANDLELREIANHTGLREGTVKRHLTRALASVRTELANGR